MRDGVELEVIAGSIRVPAHTRVEVPGRGDLRVRSVGHAPGAPVEITLGERTLLLRADEEGRVSWVGPGLLGQVAGELRVEVAGQRVQVGVRPSKLTAEAVAALVASLEDAAAGLSLAAGAVTRMHGVRTRDQDLQRLDDAVGMVASVAPAIRRRPLHRPREVVRAVPSDRGPRSARDVRWAATHPVAAGRVQAMGRQVGVVREQRRDLDTLENRGVLATLDALEGAIGELRDALDAELDRLEAGREARQAFLTESGDLWHERDLPRVRALRERRGRLDELNREVASSRRRTGLPDLRPRGRTMVRTPRVDAEPAYWTTFQAHQLVADADLPPRPPVPAPVRALDELWEQWCTVQVVLAVTLTLGPPDGQHLVDPGWFSTLHPGAVATWSTERRTVTVRYEPEIGREGTVRKLVPGRPWRPDVVVEVAWADGTLDLHVLDAKYRLDGWEALDEVWLKYGDTIGDAAGWPVVRSVWVLCPGEGRVRLKSPRMLDEAWPIERLRGGRIDLRPGEVEGVGEVMAEVLRGV